MCSKLTIKTPERQRRSGFFVANVEYTSHLSLVFLLLTLSMNLFAGLNLFSKNLCYFNCHLFYKLINLPYKQKHFRPYITAKYLRGHLHLSVLKNKEYFRSEYNFFKAQIGCPVKTMWRQTKWISDRTSNKAFFFKKKSEHQQFVWLLK